MKFKFLTILLFFIYIVTINLYSQPNVIDLQGKTNFYEIQEKFNQHWGNKKIANETPRQERIGWKQYKRWEWFWEQRVFPSGEFPSSQHNLNELKKWKNNKLQKNSNKLQSVNSWTNLGPSTSPGGYNGLGRINWVEEDPGYNGTTNKTIWVGSPSGGLWKTTDDGANWTPKFEEYNSIGVSSIVINPSNTSIMWVATGDGEVGDTKSIGVLKSTNGGESWNTTGLNWNTSDQRTIRKLIIHPTNRDILYAATSVGIYKTTNGGTNWTQVKTGNYKDIEFRPSRPDTLYASGTEIIRTFNGGSSWSTLTSGLPTSGISRIEIAVTPKNADYIYALYGKSSNQGFMGVYRSTNGGTNWTTRATSPNLLGWESNGSDNGGQAWYDLVLTVSPSSVDSVWVGGVNIWRSVNGGSNWTCVAHWYGQSGTPTVHADHHYLGFANNGYRLYSGHDGGLNRTTNGGASWSWLGSGLKITQFYKLGVAKTNPSIVIAGAQDNGTKLLKSNGTWSDVIGGDGMECAIHPTNANIMYGALYYGNLRKSTNGGSNWTDVPEPTSEDGDWVTPYLIDQNNPTHLYIGLRNVWKSTNSGYTWTKISSYTSGTLTFIALAPSNSNYIYATTGANLVRTTNGGTNWSSMTKPGATYLTYLAIHPSDPNILWATMSGYSSGNKVYKSTNGGASWTNISGANFPNIPVNTIAYQKNKNNRIYVGTDIGVFYIDDSLSSWQDFNGGLPNAPVTELEVHDSTYQIIAATYGRGVWKSEIDGAIVPTQLNPSNLAVNIEMDSQINWSKITNATYSLQVSTNSDMSNPIINKSSLSDTSWVIKDSIFNLNTNYYWRINSTVSGQTSDWSSIWNFKTKGLVSDVVLLGPINNSTSVAMDSKLIWSKISNATYQLQVSENADFSNSLIDDNQITDSLWVIKDTIFDFNTKYYWRVRAKIDTNIGNWSSAWAFTTITEYCVASSNSCDEYISKFVLDSISNTSDCSETYQDFTNIRTTLKKGIDYSVTVTNPVPYSGDAVAVWIDWNHDKDFLDSGERYYTNTNNFSTFTGIINVPSNAIQGKTTLRVRIIYADMDQITPCGDNNFGETEDYSIYYYHESIDAPILSSPSNNSTNQDINLTLSWTNVQNATNYDILVSNFSNFADTIFNINSTNTQYNLNNLNYNKDYYWKVRAKNSDTASLWSSNFKFSTMIQPVVLIYPTNNSIDQLKNLTLKWSNTNASKYQVNISKFSDMSNPIILDFCNDTNFIHNFYNGTNYYWRVRAIYNSDTSNWSSIWKFTTKDSIIAPTLVSVANNSINQLLKVNLKWNKIEIADGYIFQLATDNSFANIKYETTISDTVINSQVMNLLHSTKYYWRVRAFDFADTSDYSEVWNFTSTYSFDINLDSLVVFNSNNLKLYGNYNISDESEIIQKGFCISKESNPDLNDTLIKVIVNPLYSEQNNLEYNTEYFVRAFIKTNFGTHYSNEKSIKTEYLLNIAINKKWNLISANVSNFEDSVQTVFKDVKDSILIMKDNQGKVYIPSYDINQINKLSYRRAYLIYSEYDLNLKTSGNLIDSSNKFVDIKIGWNLFPYLLSNPQDVSLALKDLADTEKLLIIKDLEGKVYIPSYNINTLGNLIPGKGYYLYSLENVIFYYK